MFMAKKKRLNATPAKEIILERLKEFEAAWIEIRHESKRFLSEDVLKALDNFKAHVIKGSLENIPPKARTGINESLHRQLDSFINTPKCSTELFVATLALFFHKWWNEDLAPTSTYVQFPFISKLSKENTSTERFEIGVSHAELSETDNEWIKDENLEKSSSLRFFLDQIQLAIDSQCIDHSEDDTRLCEVKGKKHKTKHQTKDKTSCTTTDIPGILKRSILYLCVFNDLPDLAKSYSCWRSFTFSSYDNDDYNQKRIISDFNLVRLNPFNNNLDFITLCHTT